MGAWGKLTPEEWEEEQAWQESHPDSFSERLWDGIDDALSPPSLPDIFHEPKDDYDRGDGWGEGGSDSPGCGCSLNSCLTILLILIVLMVLGCISWYLLFSLPQLMDFVFSQDLSLILGG